MHWIDYGLIFGYLALMLGIGFYFLKRQTTLDEYFVGDRKMGAASVTVALAVPTVLESILLAYSFMVVGLFVPTQAGMTNKRVSSNAAFASMLLGGSSAVVLTLVPAINPLPEPIMTALLISLASLGVGMLIWPNRQAAVAWE
jgi:Na+/proline symporter